MRRALADFLPVQAQRWLVALGLSALVHGGLMHGGLWMRQQPPAQPAAAALAVQTRALAATAPAPAPAPAPVEVAVTGTVTVTPTAPLPRPASAQTKLTRAAPVTPAVASPAAAFSVPAPAELHYLLRQGGQVGRARLSWQPQGEGGYQLSLTRELAGRALPTWRSEGETGTQGLSPSRFAQQRQGRDTSATNFRRDEGLISFSASTEQVALMPGVQDRLSGWLQLAGLIAAAPAGFPSGSALRLTVVGLRGEAREQVFEVLGLEAVTLADGGSLSPPALHLRRAPLGVYDGGIELWLAPERGYLPVRVRVGLPEERGWELQLLNAE